MASAGKRSRGAGRALVVMLALGLGLLVLLLTGRGVEQAVHTARVLAEQLEPRQVKERTVDAAPLPNITLGTAQAMPELPETFGNTQVDGGFRLDSRGQLIPTESALRLFNYFFTATGVESEAQIRARIEAEIKRLLKPPASGQALALLDDYVGYRHAGRELAEDLEAATPEERVEALYELRRETFGPERAARLFGRDEAMREVAMERTRIVRDESLDVEQRRAALAAAEAELPEELRVRRAFSKAAARAHEDVQALRAAGASEADVLEARRAALGDEGAARMATIDGEEQGFRQAMGELRARAEAGTEQRELEAFIATRFAERDRARARALWAAGFPAR